MGVHAILITHAHQARSGPGGHPGPLIFEVKKKLRALFAKVRGDNLQKLKYYSNNQSPAVICACLIKEHLRISIS